MITLIVIAGTYFALALIVALISRDWQLGLLWPALFLQAAYLGFALILAKFKGGGK